MNTQSAPVKPAPSSALWTPPAPRWVARAEPNPEVAATLARELELPAALCRLLALRGFTQADAAKRYLKPRLDELHDPFLMAGMTEAVARLRRAISNGEKIFVHGDYDVDGICSAALYTRVLRSLGATVQGFVPHRLTDGYDLGHAGVRAAAEFGATVILTGDCGIVAHEAVLAARDLGIDVIVTDHHTPGPQLPDCCAVINPNRSDCRYPEKGLAGVGVAFKLCQALAKTYGLPHDALWYYLDLVAVATIADLAPLTGENRTLTRFGLKVLKESRNPGLAALLHTAGLGEHAVLAAGQISHVLAPRINAVGRMGQALRGVRLLLTDDPREADAIAAELEAENRWRQTVDGQTLKEAMGVLERSFDPGRDYGIVLANDGWHPGVIGIVASRVVERIHRPTVLIALNGGEDGKGSARSIGGFHLYEAIRACGEHLTRFGGHRMAAGCSIRPERVDAFRDAFNTHAHAVLRPEQLIPEVRIDLEVELHHADESLARMLRHAGPFGAGNATPVFAARRVGVVDGPRIVGQNHLKLTIGGNGRTMDAIGFNMGERSQEPWLSGGHLDVAFKLEEHHYNGRASLQAKLVDLRPAE